MVFGFWEGREGKGYYVGDGRMLVMLRRGPGDGWKGGWVNRGRWVKLVGGWLRYEVKIRFLGYMDFGVVVLWIDEFGDWIITILIRKKECERAFIEEFEVW